MAEISWKGGSKFYIFLQYLEKGSLIKFYIFSSALKKGGLYQPMGIGPIVYVFIHWKF